MITNILTEKDFQQIRGHFMGGKHLKIEREFLPENYTLTVTVKEASEVWGQKMIIHTESTWGCQYRAKYHRNLESVKDFIADDAHAMYRKQLWKAEREKGRLADGALQTCDADDPVDVGSSGCNLFDSHVDQGLPGSQEA